MVKLGCVCALPRRCLAAAFQPARAAGERRLCTVPWFVDQETTTARDSAPHSPYIIPTIRYGSILPPD
jgi:hypothetical protein